MLEVHHKDLIKIPLPYWLQHIAYEALQEIYSHGAKEGMLCQMLYFKWKELSFFKLIVLGFNDTSTLEGHFVSSPREREKRDRRESKGDEREGQGRKRNRNESEETEEIKTFPLYPYPLQG